MGRIRKSGKDARNAVTSGGAPTHEHGQDGTLANKPIKHRLWALSTTEENIKKAASYEFSYACADHILIVSESAPEGAREVTDAWSHLLSSDDWMWIKNVSDVLREREEIKYAKEIAEAQNRFFERFKANLQKIAEETENERNNADS